MSKYWSLGVIIGILGMFSAHASYKMGMRKNAAILSGLSVAAAISCAFEIWLIAAVAAGGLHYFHSWFLFMKEKKNRLYALRSQKPGIERATLRKHCKCS